MNVGGEGVMHRGYRRILNIPLLPDRMFSDSLFVLRVAFLSAPWLMIAFLVSLLLSAFLQFLFLSAIANNSVPFPLPLLNGFPVPPFWSLPILALSFILVEAGGGLIGERLQIDIHRNALSKLFGARTLIVSDDPPLRDLGKRLNQVSVHQSTAALSVVRLPIAIGVIVYAWLSLLRMNMVLGLLLLTPVLLAAIAAPRLSRTLRHGSGRYYAQSMGEANRFLHRIWIAINSVSYPGLNSELANFLKYQSRHRSTALGTYFHDLRQVRSASHWMVGLLALTLAAPLLYMSLLSAGSPNQGDLLAGLGLMVIIATQGRQVASASGTLSVLFPQIDWAINLERLGKASAGTSRNSTESRYPRDSGLPIMRPPLIVRICDTDSPRALGGHLVAKRKRAESVVILSQPGLEIQDEIHRQDGSRTEDRLSSFDSLDLITQRLTHSGSRKTPSFILLVDSKTFLMDSDEMHWLITNASQTYIFSWSCTPSDVELTMLLKAVKTHQGIGYGLTSFTAEDFLFDQHACKHHFRGASMRTQIEELEEVEGQD